MNWFEILKNWEAFSWIIPGVIFIHFHNKLRPMGTISLSGWSYFITFIMIAFAVSIITNTLPSHWFEGTDFFKLVLSLLIAILLAIACKFKIIAKYILSDIHDIFCKNCQKWEKEFIITSLSNKKTYIGQLRKYPENPREKLETQCISIVPCLSGYRDDAKELKWTYYPDSKSEIIIPRKEIITFGLYDEKIFKSLSPKLATKFS